MNPDGLTFVCGLLDIIFYMLILIYGNGRLATLHAVIILPPIPGGLEMRHGIGSPSTMPTPAPGGPGIRPVPRVSGIDSPLFAGLAQRSPLTPSTRIYICFQSVFIAVVKNMFLFEPGIMATTVDISF